MHQMLDPVCGLRPYDQPSMMMPMEPVNNLGIAVRRRIRLLLAREALTQIDDGGAIWCELTLELAEAQDRAGQTLNARATFMQVAAEPRSRTSATSLDDLQGIEPIAEALIKTLAGKARTGRLDELKALELLQQAVLL